MRRPPYQRFKLGAPTVAKVRHNQPQNVASADAATVSAWLTTYSGKFQYLKDMQGELTKQGLTDAQWGGVIKCYNKDRSNKSKPNINIITPPVPPAPPAPHAATVITSVGSLSLTPNSSYSTNIVVDSEIGKAIPTMSYDPSSQLIDVVVPENENAPLEFSIKETDFFTGIKFNSLGITSLKCPDEFILKNIKTGKEVLFRQIMSYTYTGAVDNKRLVNLFIVASK
jgi:hypothetical protein